jgi:hypothetical protein
MRDTVESLDDVEKENRELLAFSHSYLTIAL